MKDWTPIILAFIAMLGGGGGIYAAFTVKATRRKLVADAEAVNANTTTVLGGFAVDVLLKPLRERIAELEKEVEELRRRVREAYQAQDEMEQMRAQIRRYEQEIAELKLTVKALSHGGTLIADPDQPPGPPPARG